MEMEVSIWSLNCAGCPEFLAIKSTKSVPNDSIPNVLPISNKATMTWSHAGVPERLSEAEVKGGWHTLQEQT